MQNTFQKPVKRCYVHTFVLLVNRKYNFSIARRQTDQDIIFLTFFLLQKYNIKKLTTTRIENSKIPFFILPSGQYYFSHFCRYQNVGKCCRKRAKDRKNRVIQLYHIKWMSGNRFLAKNLIALNYTISPQQSYFQTINNPIFIQKEIQQDSMSTVSYVNNYIYFKFYV